MENAENMSSKCSEYEIKVISIVVVKITEQLLTKSFSWEYDETEFDE